MRAIQYVMLGTVSALLNPANRVMAQTQTELTELLLRKVEQLEQKIRVLERNEELVREGAAEKSKTAPSISLGAGGLLVQTADTNFVRKIRGYLQADARHYLNDVSPQNDTFLFRRLRPIIEGTVYEKFDYRLMLDLASNSSLTRANNALVQDAYLTARFLPELQVQVGKMKEPVGLERLQSGANLLFIERSYPTQLLPNRDVGVQLQGSLWKDTLAYAVGVFNGVADGGSGDLDAADDDKDLAARLFTHPFKNTRFAPLQGLGFGVAGTLGNQERALRSYSSPGQQTIFSYITGAGTAASPNVTADGEHWRISPQFYYYWGPFGLLGEYALSSQEVAKISGPTTVHGRMANQAWHLAASYFLTGEDNSFRPVAPRHPFNFGGGHWGAWEVAARVSQIEFDSAAFPVFASSASNARRALTFGAGVNWHINRNIKVSLDYEQTELDGGAASPLLSKGERVIFSRVQFGF